MRSRLVELRRVCCALGALAVGFGGALAPAHAQEASLGLRGETVDEAALIATLRDGRIAGAGLDVFASEPLPAESPIWDLPNVFISPHIGGLFIEYQQMAMPLIINNFSAFLSGNTDQMTNVIDRSRSIP